MSKSIETSNDEAQLEALAKKYASELSEDEEKVRQSGKRIFRVRVVLETDVLVLAKDAEEAADLAEIHWNGFEDQEPFTDYEPISSEAKEVTSFEQVEDLEDVLCFYPVADCRDEPGAAVDETDGLGFNVREYLRALKVPGEDNE